MVRVCMYCIPQLGLISGRLHYLDQTAQHCSALFIKKKTIENPFGIRSFSMFSLLGYIAFENNFIYRIMKLDFISYKISYFYYDSFHCHSTVVSPREVETA